MKELKILAVVVFFTLITYWGVEPFAHSQMHKHVEGNNFNYNGKPDIEEVKAKIEEAKKNKEDTTKLEQKLQEKKKFWSEVEQIAKLKGNPQAGEAVFGMCLGCHNGSGTSMGGVVPPSLDHAGALYDKKYLIALIKDPAMASNVDHKYADTSMHPMGPIKTMVTDPQQIADVVAYIMKNKAGEITPKKAFVDACGRCHANRYGKWTQAGFVPKTKADIKTGQDLQMLKFKEKVAKTQMEVANYMGKLPPDLSIIIRARSPHYLETFVENPQTQLPGTAMPRTGLTKESYEKVVEYLKQTGDPSEKERKELGPKVIAYFVIFAILAYLWKKSIWKRL